MNVTIELIKGVIETCESIGATTETKAIAYDQIKSLADREQSELTVKEIINDRGRKESKIQ